jgi:hypothetical protein
MDVIQFLSQRCSNGFGGNAGVQLKTVRFTEDSCALTITETSGFSGLVGISDSGIALELLRSNRENLFQYITQALLQVASRINNDSIANWPAWVFHPIFVLNAMVKVSP